MKWKVNQWKSKLKWEKKKSHKTVEIINKIKLFSKHKAKKVKTITASKECQKKSKSKKSKHQKVPK